MRASGKTVTKPANLAGSAAFYSFHGCLLWFDNPPAYLNRRADEIST
jgi:hypothetical protein